MKSLFVSFLFLFQFNIFARVIVITDMDDTIKTANSMGNVLATSYHFLKKGIYTHQRDLYRELKNFEESKGEEVDFYYVSAAPDVLFNQQKWIKKNGFPVGKTFLRSIGSGKTYEFKYNVIVNILRPYLDDPNLRVIFFGDNSSKDPAVYIDATVDYKLNSKIYIRDVSTFATEFDGLSKVFIEGPKYYFSERELFGDEYLIEFMSKNLKHRIKYDYMNRSLIPNYTKTTLSKRIRKKKGCRLFQLKCRKEAKYQATNLWLDYYDRF